jgi:phage gp29-like protein
MKRQLVKQKARVYRWDGFSGGIELPEITLGYIVIERTFKVFNDGHFKLDSTQSEKLLTVDGRPINCLWSEAVLQEFFPGFTGYELEGEV